MRLAPDLPQLRKVATPAQLRRLSSLDLLAQQAQLAATPLQTNLITSQDLSSAYWAKVAYTFGTPDLFTETAVDGYRRLAPNADGVITRAAGVKTYRVTVDVELVAGGPTKAYIQAFDGSFGSMVMANFNVATNTMGYVVGTNGWTAVSGNVATLANGKKRCSVEFTTDATTTGLYLAFRAPPADSNDTWAGATSRAIRFSNFWAYDKNQAIVAAAPIVVKQIGSQLRTGTTATGATTLASVTAGNTLLVIVNAYESSIDSVVGSRNGAFAKIADVSLSYYNRMTVWGINNAQAGTETITATAGNPGGAYMSGTSMEIAGVSAVDAITSAANTLTVTASRPNAKASSLVIVGNLSNTGGNVGFGTPAGHTLIDRENDADSYTGYQASYRIATAPETPTATATASQDASQFHSLILNLIAP